MLNKLLCKISGIRYYRITYSAPNIDTILKISLSLKDQSLYNILSRGGLTVKEVKPEFFYKRYSCIGGGKFWVRH